MKNKKIYSGKIPFINGNQLNSTRFYNFKNIEWVDNTIFEAEMTITDYSNGNSSSYFELIDDMGNKYTMYISHFIDLLRDCSIDKGKIEGKHKYTFTKLNTSYSLVFIE